MTEAAEPTELTNKSVTKAVRLLRELAAQPRSGATVTTLAKAVGISRPTAFRLLYSLERTGLVDRIDDAIRRANGYAKQGAGYGYSKAKGLDALLGHLHRQTG